MNLKVLRHYELNIDLIKKLSEETTSFALCRGSKYLGWTFVGEDEKYQRRVAVYKPDGTIEYLPNGTKNIGIRLAVNYLELKPLCKKQTRIDDRFLEVEAGEYPQECVEFEKQEKLDYDLLNGRLSETGKTYVSHDNTYSQAVDLKEVVDQDGNKYVNKNCTWYKVSPVKWIVDEHRGLAMSKYIITGGVSYGDLYPTRYHYEYMLKSSNNIFGYLNRLAKELIPSVTSLKLDPPAKPPQKWDLPLVPFDPIPGRNPYEPCDPIPGRNPYGPFNPIKKPWKIGDPPFIDPEKRIWCEPEKVKTIGTIK